MKKFIWHSYNDLYFVSTWYYSKNSGMFIFDEIACVNSFSKVQDGHIWATEKCKELNQKSKEEGE